MPAVSRGVLAGCSSPYTRCFVSSLPDLAAVRAVMVIPAPASMTLLTFRNNDRER
jgi:hypothetical protein